jgi:hypothetical protein
MIKQSKATSDTGDPPLTAAEKNLISSFRSYLQLVITADQMGERVNLSQRLGPITPSSCRALAKMPGYTLASELGAPVLAILEQINKITLHCDVFITLNEGKDPLMQSELEAVLEQLDMALARILGAVITQARVRAEFSRSCELLAPLIIDVMGHGADAARLIRRYQQLFPNDAPIVNGEVQPESFPDLFAWEAYTRIMALEKLAEDFPAHIRPSARAMKAWPMLCHRHTFNRRHFTKLAERLQLGTEYPVDVSEAARFRPDTPMVAYLLPLIERLHCVWHVVRREQYESVAKEKERLAHLWRSWPEKTPGDEVLDALCGVRLLAPLTKKTAHGWAKTVLVPLIMATDARDWNHCAEPMLRNIAEQKGVKSRATFKSRLLAAVSHTLQGLARQA